MLTQSSIALAGFIGWTLALLALMEAIRSWLVISGKVVANGFTPDNANLAPFMQRLARAHANCVESLPVFGGLLILGIATDRTALTDPLACWLLGARMVQSLVHLASTSPAAVTTRFTAFAAQMGIGIHWCILLLLG